ncbi:MAG: S1C family serine protease [Crocinitomicaceae bacterium]
MIFNLSRLNQFFLILTLSLLASSCSSDDVTKAHTKSKIDVLILDGKVDVSIEENFKVISEFKNVDSFRVETDVKLQAILSSKNAKSSYLHIVPGISAERDAKGIEKIYVIRGTERTKAASIKKDFDFQLKVINRSIYGFSTRYSHYESIESFYDNINEPEARKRHVWGSGTTTFVKRHQERILDRINLTDIFDYEFDLKPIFDNNSDPFLSSLRSFEIGFHLDSLFIIGVENEVLTVQLNGKWQLFNGFDECISSFPIKTYASSDYYLQENISDQWQKSEMEKVVSEAFLNSLTYSLLSEEFKKHLRSAIKIREEDSSKNSKLGRLKLQKKRASSSSERNLLANQSASVAVIGENSTGSGSVISSDGYILTNYHVIASIKDDIEVVFPNGKTIIAEIARVDRDIDAAVLKIDSEGLFTTELDSKYNVQVGEKIYTIATPQNVALINTVSFGHVSALRNIGSIRYIQSDGNFLKGTSGGPLFNEKGRQIGINVLGWQNNGVSLEGLNFAIPIDIVLERLNLQL